MNLLIEYRRANRQYVAMSREEVWKFVDSQKKLYVAFPMSNGFPHISPLWFCIINDKLYFRTHDYKVKTGLAKSGQACCSIDAGDTYRELRGVIIWGRSRVITESSLIDKVSATMDEKYKELQWKKSQMPKEWVEERKGESRAFIEITPQKISSWDNRKV